MADFEYQAQVFAKTVDLQGGTTEQACPTSQVIGQGSSIFEYPPEPPVANVFQMPGDGSTAFTADDNSTENPLLQSGDFFAHYWFQPTSVSGLSGISTVDIIYRYQAVRLNVSGVTFATPRVDGKPDPTSYAYPIGTNQQILSPPFPDSFSDSVVVAKDSVYQYIFSVEFAYVTTGAAKNSWLSGLGQFAPFSVFYTIIITRQQIAPFVSSTTKTKQAGHFPTIRGAMSLAVGGTPRLILALVRTYQELNITEVNQGGVWTIQVDGSWVGSAVRVCRSPDFGETFEPGADIEAESFFDDQLISDGRTTTQSVGPIAWSPGQPIPLPVPDFNFPMINSLVVFPHGRISVNGTHQGSGSPQDWAAPRLTDDVTGQSGWRDSNTPNQHFQATIAGRTYGFPTGNPVTKSFAGFINGPTANVSTWLTSGSYQGTKGAGGKSSGPSMMRGMSGDGRLWFSEDCGDTWQLDVPPQAPAGFQVYGHGLTGDNCVFQKGQAYDGVRWSPTGFEGWVYFKQGPGDYINPQAMGVPAASPFPGAFWLARSAEGEVIRAICFNTHGVLSLTALRYGLGTGYQLANPMTPSPGGFLRTGSSGIPPGIYKVGYTLLSNGIQAPVGETEISPLVTWTVPGLPSTVNQIVNFLPLPSGVGGVNGQTVANVYCSDAPGSSTLRLVGSVTAADLATFVIDALPAPNAPEPPATNTTGPLIAQPANTLLYEGNYWDAPTPIEVSTTGDGNNLIPLPFNVPANSGYAIQVCAWMQRVLLLIAIDDTVQILVTENAGQWWRATCYSKDNGVSWPTGMGLM